MTTKTSNGRVTPKKAAATSAFTIDAESLSLGDCIDFEDVVGMSIDEAIALAKKGLATAKMMCGFYWIARRQTDPTFTFEDAKSVKVSALSEAPSEPT